VAELWSVHADPEACDLAIRAPGAGRVAPDEVFVRGPVADDLRRAIRKVDPAAVIRQADDGWAEATISRDTFSRLSALELPPSPAYLQGEVAGVPARVFAEDDVLTVFVAAPFEAHLRRRLQEESG
jgi:hypothetical protein